MLVHVSRRAPTAVHITDSRSLFVLVLTKCNAIYLRVCAGSFIMYPRYAVQFPLKGFGLVALITSARATAVIIHRVRSPKTRPWLRPNGAFGCL